MSSLGFALLVLWLSLQFIPLVFLEIIGEAGIGFDLFISVGVLAWIGSQGNAWLRKDALSRGFKPAPTSAESEGVAD